MPAQAGRTGAGRMKWLALFGLDGPLQRLRDTASEAAQAAEDRVELLAIEWAEEKQRWARLSLLAVLAAVLTAVLCIVLSVAVLVQFWEGPWRSAAAWGLAAFWTLAWAGVIGLLAQCLRQGREAFALSRRELGRDWAELKEGL